MTKPVPETIGGARVIGCSPIDDRHHFTGNTRQIVAGQVIGAMSGVAICQYEGENCFYLFGCDAEWRTTTDTWHQTFEDALRQAEFEYAGVSLTWTYPQSRLA
jgi:hypothetical protein